MHDQDPAPTEAALVASDIILHLFPWIHKAIGPLIEQERLSAGRCGKNQEKALMILGDGGPMIASRLGECMDLRRGSLTALVDGLEAMGFVTRRPDAHDRRKAVLELSPAGRAYTERRRERLKAAIARKLMTLHDSEREDFERGLAATARGLQRFSTHK